MEGSRQLPINARSVKKMRLIDDPAKEEDSEGNEEGKEGEEEDPDVALTTSSCGLLIGLNPTKSAQVRVCLPSLIETMPESIKP